MRRFLILLLLSAVSLPVGMSVVGCKKGIAITYCNGGDTGLEVGQASDIKLNPQITGISLNYGETQQLSAPVATDCKGNTVAQSSFNYGSTNINIIDVSPSGNLCAGSWNRNSPAGIANFTTCTATNQSGVAYLTATAGTTTSNVVQVYSHPVVTSIVLGASQNSSGATISGCVSQGNTVTLNSISYAGTTPLSGIVSNITSWSIASGVATFNTPAGNSLSAGQLVVLNGFGNALTLTSAATATGGNTVYTGTILGGASNGLVGQKFLVAGFDNSANNGTFTVTASTATTLTLNNAAGVADTYGATATPTAVGSIFNGLVETVLPGVTSTQFQVNLSAGSATVNQGNTATTSIYGTATTTIGSILYQATNGTIVNIENTTTGQATALQPGATLITAQLSTASSTAGYFYTCPPATITLVPGYSSGSSVIVDQNYTDPLTATVVDTNGNTITGLNLTFNSTTPATTTVASGGLITATYPGTAAVSAECLPQTCNPAPLSQTGIYGTGQPITSNSLGVTTPGSTATILYMASTQSQYFASIDFTTGIVGTPVRLPYVPNSMVADPGGDTLYFGSPEELMIVSTSNGSITKEDVTATGSVLGVSPNGQTLVISDPVHSLIYLYNTSAYTYTTYGGTGTKAVFTPDNQTVYISGGSEEYVYSLNSGWNQYQATTTNVSDVTIASPSVGAFFAGSNTTARSYCANNTTTPITYYPATSDSQIATQKVSATFDGNHVLGANLVGSTPTLYDIGVVTPVQACPASGTVPNFSSALRKTVTPPITTATAVTGVPVSSNSLLAFLTYTVGSSAATTGAILPSYAPAVTGAGTAQNVTLASGASAPVAGVFSPDNLTFYAGTSGDDKVHIISTGYLTITGWNISGNVVTFTTSNTLTAGQQVTLSGFGTSTFFNGQTVTVLSTGLSTSQFEANFTHASGSAVETGTGSTGTQVDTKQISPNLPFNNGLNGQYAAPNLLAVRPRNSD